VYEIDDDLVVQGPREEVPEADLNIVIKFVVRALGDPMETFWIFLRYLTRLQKKELANCYRKVKKNSDKSSQSSRLFRFYAESGITMRVCDQIGCLKSKFSWLFSIREVMQAFVIVRIRSGERKIEN
jgi:hypothetical protein